MARAKSGPGAPIERVQGQLVSVRQAAFLYDMPLNTVNRRVYRLGWTLEQAVLTPILPVGHRGKMEAKRLHAGG